MLRLIFSVTFFIISFYSYSQKRVKAKDFTWYSNAKELAGIPNVTDSLFVIFEFKLDEDPHFLVIEDEINFIENIYEIEEIGLYLDKTKDRYVFFYNFGKYTDLVKNKKFRLMVDVYDGKEKKIRNFHILKSDLINLKDLFED
jgi:hypothetical protein